VPVLLVHGFGASIGHWRKNIAVLAQHHPVYAIDLLGFGASRKPNADYGAGLWGAQLQAFCEQVIGRPVAIVGNSIGSLVGLDLAQRLGDRAVGVAALSLPDPSLRDDLIPAALQPIVTTLEQWVASPWLLKAIFFGVRRPSFVRRWAAIAYCDRTAITDELVEILSRPAYDTNAANAFVRIFRAMGGRALGPGARSLLRELTCPVLLVWGEGDRMIPPSLAPQFAACNPRLELVMLPHAGHCPHDECPDRLNSLLLDWLAALATTTKSGADAPAR
jgi:haloalkane dehalogenase